MSKRGRPPHPGVLTERERQVLDLIKEGLSNEEIADKLGISLDGVKYHVSQILAKLDVRSRREAALWRPEEQRPAWLGAGALALLRRPRLGWLPISIVGAMALVAAIAVGILVWSLAVVSDESDAAADIIAVQPQPIAAGERHTCVITSSGGVACWGMNGSGQLGDGTTEWPRTTAVNVKGLPDRAVALAAGYSHTCALMAATSVWCWGTNGDGQLGDGTGQSSTTPVEVKNLHGRAAAITAGFYHTCALLTTGSVTCWGENAYGQLGDGTQQRRKEPVEVNLDLGALAITTAGYQTCAITFDHEVQCWGRAWDGLYEEQAFFFVDGALREKIQGTPRPNERFTALPVAVRHSNGKVLGSALAVAAGGGRWAHACALTVSDGIWCWGSNVWGELGDGQAGEGYYRSVAAIRVAGSYGTAASLAAGGIENQGGHTCLLAAEGAVYCWGRGYEGQLGDGKADHANLGGSDEPTLALLDAQAVAVAAGGRHTCAITTSARIFCWGENEYGQLGDGARTWRAAPVEVPGVLAWVP